MAHSRMSYVFIFAGLTGCLHTRCENRPTGHSAPGPAVNAPTYPVRLPAYDSERVQTATRDILKKFRIVRADNWESMEKGVGAVLWNPIVNESLPKYDRRKIAAAVEALSSDVLQNRPQSWEELNAILKNYTDTLPQEVLENIIASRIIQRTSSDQNTGAEDKKQLKEIQNNQETIRSLPSQIEEASNSISTKSIKLFSQFSPPGAAIAPMALAPQSTTTGGGSPGTEASRFQRGLVDRENGGTPSAGLPEGAPSKQNSLGKISRETTGLNRDLMSSADRGSDPVASGAFNPSGSTPSAALGNGAISKKNSLLGAAPKSARADSNAKAQENVASVGLGAAGGPPSIATPQNVAPKWTLTIAEPPLEPPADPVDGSSDLSGSSALSNAPANGQDALASGTAAEEGGLGSLFAYLEAWILAALDAEPNEITKTSGTHASASTVLGLEGGAKKMAGLFDGFDDWTQTRAARHRSILSAGGGVGTEREANAGALPSLLGSGLVRHLSNARSLGFRTWEMVET